VTLETVGFWAVAIVLLASSLGVVVTPNLFHAVLYLAGALVATAAIFLLLASPFLFAVQLLLYAGGVVTIVVFAIMLTERLVGERITQTSRYMVNAAIVSAAVFFAIVGFLLEAPAVTPVSRPSVADQTTAIGQSVMSTFALPFELLGVLLVAALLGAIYFARAEE
jgi:NADH-quinone oxidoreductase subunit J